MSNTNDIALRRAQAAALGMEDPAVATYVFALCADVPNPKHDARVKNDWRGATVFPQGLRFRMRTEFHGVTSWPVLEVMPRQGRGRFDLRVHLGNDLWPVIVEQLTRVEETAEERLSRMLDNEDGEEVLLQLITTGHVEWSVVDAAIAAVRTRGETS